MQEQIDYVMEKREQGLCKIIAINRTGLHKPPCAPFSELLWGCDARDNGFWRWHPEAIEFPGTKVVVRGVSPNPETWRRLKQLNDAGVKVIKHSGHKLMPMSVHEDVSHDPAIVHGDNGLSQILSVIHHTGASTVLLLGVLMKPGRAHGNYPGGSGEPTYAASVIPRLATFVAPLRRADVAVLNCSPGSALPYFEHVRLEAVL